MENSSSSSGQGAAQGGGHQPMYTPSYATGYDADAAPLKREYAAAAAGTPNPADAPPATAQSSGGQQPGYQQPGYQQPAYMQPPQGYAPHGYPPHGYPPHGYPPQPYQQPQQASGGAAVQYQVNSYAQPHHVPYAPTVGNNAQAIPAPVVVRSSGMPSELKSFKTWFVFCAVVCLCYEAFSAAVLLVYAFQFYPWWEFVMWGFWWGLLAFAHGTGVSKANAWKGRGTLVLVLVLTLIQALLQILNVLYAWGFYLIIAIVYEILLLSIFVAGWALCKRIPN